MTTLQTFQNLLREKNITAYIIPTSDYHLSEYISDFFKTRNFLCPFTGSAGTLIVTPYDALLWTDGRYFIQAEKELLNSNISLMKSGQKNIPTPLEYLQSILKPNNILGLDAKVFSTSFILKIKSLIPNIEIYNSDLINELWKTRPSLPFTYVFKLEDIFTGKNIIEKISIVRKEIINNNATTHIISSLEEQAWLFNLRGHDVKNTPVFLSFTIIDQKNVYLFIDKNKLNKEIRKYLEESNVVIFDYAYIYDFISKIHNEKILISYDNINYNIYSSIHSSNTIINKNNPILLLKSIKNDIEIKNTRLAHIKDGVAMTKLLFFIKTNKNYSKLSELDIAEIIENFRKEQLGYIENSFSTISAYKEHGAMMHYSATKESNFVISNDGFLLLDSGAHYLEGTTDITRTILIGNATEKMKLHYTTVLKALISLSTSVFMSGIKGTNLDILARGPIWKLLIDYKCGTGHGVGHILSVHEGPNSFRWHTDNAILIPGMITTNEPGIYLENEYGIRLENELLVIEKAKNEFGDFLEFETLTYCPFDLEAINHDILTLEEKEWLNNYHQLVYNKISTFLSFEEREWYQFNILKK